jgi:hypothetical protein
MLKIITIFDGCKTKLHHLALTKHDNKIRIDWQKT